MRRLLNALGIVLLGLSLILLVWGSLPSRREVRTQPISPAELQLPTPITLYLELA
jgi:hypothetical protein